MRFLLLTGSRIEAQGEIFLKLFNRPYFRVKVVQDQAGVEIFGAVKVSTPCLLSKLNIPGVKTFSYSTLLEMQLIVVMD